MALSSRIGRKVIVVLATDIRATSYYEILVENEAARYLEHLKRCMDRCCGNRKHAVWLLDDNVRPHHYNDFLG